MEIDPQLEHLPPPPARTDYSIGAIGAGFIMRDVQLVSYRNAGFNVAAITSRTPEIAREVADLRAIPRVYDTYEELLDDPTIDILDIAVPPDKQLPIVRKAAAKQRKVKAILAQKPLATNYDDAVEIVRICREAGIKLSVNQNMRYDHSIRALRSLLKRGYLGEPVLATIEMRAVPHWQQWLREYGRLTLLNMSVHHLDCFRFLFGNPDSVYTSVRKDPRTKFQHEDGICLYILEYENGFRASGWDDVWAGPKTAGNGQDFYIKWRIEGTDGLAEGSIGWPHYPDRRPSTLRFATNRQPDTWFTPQWPEAWFPDAFAGPMGELMDALANNRETEDSGDDNLHTMALIEACYKSIAERRSVAISEIRAATPVQV